MFREKGYDLFSIISQFNHSVMSYSLQPYGLQHTRPPCPSPTPGVYSNSCPLSQWCHPTISSSVAPFSSHLQSFPASGSFPISQFFVSGGQSIRVSASASVLPMNVWDWFPLGLTGWISLQSKGLSRVFSNTTGFHLHMWSSWCFSWQSWFQLVLQSTLAFCMMYSAYKLNKQNDRYTVLTYSFPNLESKNTQKNYTKKIFLTQIITLVWSLRARHPEMQSQMGLRKHHYEQS